MLLLIPNMFGYFGASSGGPVILYPLQGLQSCNHHMIYAFVGFVPALVVTQLPLLCRFACLCVRMSGQVFTTMRGFLSFESSHSTMTGVF